MSKTLKNSILAGTALALVLTMATGNAWAQRRLIIGDPSASSGIPVPEPADVPPPSLKDIGIAPSRSARPEIAPAITNSTPAASASAVATDADPQIVEKLREVVTARIDRFLERKNDAKIVETFYANRNFAPLWVSPRGANERATLALARMKSSDADGLNPADYSAPDFKAGDAEALAQAELKFTSLVLTFARHLQAGRFSASRLGMEIEVPQEEPEAAAILLSIADSRDVAATLDGFSPPHAGYRALKAKLAELRGSRTEEREVIPAGPNLRIGMSDQRVPMLRERLGVAGKPGDTTYTKPLAQAVAKFQQSRGLRPTGLLDAQTTAAFNGPARDRKIDAVIATMERWRWVPRNLGKHHVMVNLPGFSLKVMRDDKTIWATRIVVGKPSQATPIFSDEIENIVVNPTWYVPESIIYNEYLPHTAGDPTALARYGIIAEREPDGGIRMYQPPGPGNALGHLKFNFPNKFAVYLHDTPEKHLFAREVRAYSHGCMRVQNPAQFGEVLLSIGLPKEGFTAQRLQRMYGTTETQLKFQTVVPVHLTYQTAYVDDDGKLVVRDDIYNLDRKVHLALRGDFRVMAGVERERAVRKQQIAERRREWQSRSAAFDAPRGFPFFERLFTFR
jgi:murein L,D-transpeptidase YcbB/YkuD